MGFGFQVGSILFVRLGGTFLAVCRMEKSWAIGIGDSWISCSTLCCVGVEVEEAVKGLTSRKERSPVLIS